jgi:hypothetical protein
MRIQGFDDYSTSKLEISTLFLFLWVIFALLDPAPDPDPARQGAQIRKEASQREYE